MKPLYFYRNNKSKWSELANSPKISTSQHNHTYDENEKARYALLIELQYDLKEDLGLVRYLLEQEIIARENGSVAGAGEALLLNIYLLAKFNSYEDVVLFHSAKYANFDASCAVDSRFLSYALKDKSEAFIEQHYPEIYKTIRQCDSQEHGEKQLADWWQSLSDVYPKKVEDEYLYTLYERSIYFDDYKLAREYLEKWKEDTPDSANKDSTLKYMYLELKDYANAITLLKKELVASNSHWDKTSCYQSLLDLYTKSEQPIEGFEVVKHRQ